MIETHVKLPSVLKIPSFRPPLNSVLSITGYHASACCSQDNSGRSTATFAAASDNVGKCRGPMLPEVLVAEIKGSVLVDTIEAIKARAGEGELARIIEHLSPDTRSIFDQPIRISNWYSLDAFVEFLDVDVRETAFGNREVLTTRSEKVIETQLRGIYKIFVKLGSPGFVITRISAVHATYFKGVEIIPEVEDHSAVIKYIGFQKHHDILEFTILGFFWKALEISGAKHAALKFTIPISQGGAYSELTITWE
jgi:hypothetical protein